MATLRRVVATFSVTPIRANVDNDSECNSFNFSKELTKSYNIIVAV